MTKALPPGSTALVTGASSGIGEAFARRLAKRGHGLVLVARRRERLEMLATALAAIHGIDAEVVAADLTDRDGLELVAQRIERGDIQLLVNNAGFGTVGRFAALPVEREVGQLDLNARALLRLTHAGLATMLPRGSGAVLNVASMAAFQPVPYNATYAATKAFVLHLSEALHEEAKPHGVVVTCLCPGPVRTEFQHVAGIDGHRMRGQRLLHYLARISVDDVVSAGLEGVERGSAVVVPGAANQAIARTARAGPRSLIRRLSGCAFAGQQGQETSNSLDAGPDW